MSIFSMLPCLHAINFCPKNRLFLEAFPFTSHPNTITPKKEKVCSFHHHRHTSLYIYMYINPIYIYHSLHYHSSEIMEYSDLIPGLPADLGLECLIRIPHHHLSSAASVCRSWKRQIHLPEFWRRRKLAGLTQRVLIMAQSRLDPTRELASRKFAPVPSYRLTLCEPETGSWAELPPVPGHSDGLPMHCQMVGVGLNLVLMGGWDPETGRASPAVSVYDFLSAAWRRGADMPGGDRFFFACASDNARTVFVAGGHDSDKCALRSALAYDVACDTWRALPDMVRERDEPKGVYHRGAFHVMGGYPTNMQGGFESNAESFDFATWTWGPVREGFLHATMCPRDCVDGGDGRLLCCQDGEVAALEGSTWRVIAKVPCDVRNTAVVTAWQGKVAVIGAERFGGAYVAYVLDWERCKWERVDAEEEFTGHVQSGCLCGIVGNIVVLKFVEFPKLIKCWSLARSIYLYKENSIFNQYYNKFSHLYN